MSEQQMRDGLRSAASGAGTPALTLDDVRGRARGIRRRRAAVGAGGAAALVAAAVVPVALLAGGGASTDTLPPADATPTVIDTANPVVEAYPPGWIVDGEVRSSDGTAFTPDVEGDITHLLRLGADRWVLGSQGPDGGFEVLVVDGSGMVEDAFDAQDAGMVGDDSGTAVAWFDREDRPTVLTKDAAAPSIWSIIGEGDPRPVDLLEGCDAEGCRLVAETDLGDGRRTVLVDQDGLGSTFDRFGVVELTDVSPDGTLVAGFTEQADDGSCSAVVDVESGRLLWETCNASTLRFSPNGGQVLAIDARLSGFGHSFVEVRNALDGTVERRFDGGTIFDERWDSEDSFLVSLQSDEGRNELLRVGIDPAEMEVLESAPGTPGDPEGIVRLGG